MADSKKRIASTPSKNQAKRAHLHDLNESVIRAQGMNIASEDEVTGDDEMPLSELEKITNVALKKLCPFLVLSLHTGNPLPTPCVNDQRRSRNSSRLRS